MSRLRDFTLLLRCVVAGLSHLRRGFGFASW